MSEVEKFYYPNKMGRIILLAAEEVIGRSGVSAMLNQAQLNHLVGNYPPNNLDLQFSFDCFQKFRFLWNNCMAPEEGEG